MRHLKSGRKFGRTRDQRKALLRNLAFQFFLNGKITTTEAKAKELRPFVEKIITAAKKNDIARRRQLTAMLPARIIPKIINEIAPKKLSESKGGYTRIIKSGNRKSDGAKMTLLELI